MAKPKPTKMLAVLGRSRRTGRWRLASRSSVLSVLGSCHLDMTNSFVDDKEKLKMTVNVFLGSATFILPDGAEVRPSGTAILAASMVDVPDHDDTTELPTLDIEWTCLFGRIRILSEDAAAKLAAKQQQKKLEKAIKKGKAEPVIEATATPQSAAEAVASRSETAIEAPVEAAEPAPAGPEATVETAPEPPGPATGVEPDESVGVDGPEPVVTGVGFDDLPVGGSESESVAADVDGPEPVVTGVGFDDLPAGGSESESESVDVDGPEPVVTGVGFDDLPVAADVDGPEPVVTGVGFDDLPVGGSESGSVAADVGVDGPEPVVTGVGFDDLPVGESESGSESVAADVDQAAEESDGNTEADEETSSNGSDIGFVDMEYDPDAAEAAI